MKELKMIDLLKTTAAFRAARPSETVGTSLVGYLKLDYNQLVEMFGEPHFVGDGDDKVYNEWAFVIDGYPVTIYDYKENGAGIQSYAWHIGGKRSGAGAALNDYLKEKNISNLVYST
jgi:hypothetical protein